MFYSPDEWLHAPAGDRTWNFVASFQLAPEVDPQEGKGVPPSRAEQFRATLASEPGITRAEVARRFGVSRAAITQALRGAG
jgi:hypothetical protein